MPTILGDFPLMISVPDPSSSEDQFDSTVVTIGEGTKIFLTLENDYKNCDFDVDRIL